MRIIDTESVINASPCMISNLFLGSWIGLNRAMADNKAIIDPKNARKASSSMFIVVGISNIIPVSSSM